MQELEPIRVATNVEFKQEVLSAPPIIEHGQSLSPKEALIALSNDEKLQYQDVDGNWVCMDMATHHSRKFRKIPKPKPPIEMVDVKIPKSFIPKIGETYYVISWRATNGYVCKTYSADLPLPRLGAWHTEEEVKMVVEALEGGLCYENI